MVTALYIVEVYSEPSNSRHPSDSFPRVCCDPASWPWLQVMSNWANQIQEHAGGQLSV